MAKIIQVIDTCKKKISPQCEGTFEYVRKRGRPPTACNPCREIKPVSTTPRPRVVTVTGKRPTEATCGCGTVFAVKPQGKISNRCETCRKDGKVYRADDAGKLVKVTEAELVREELERERKEQERKTAEGKARAENLMKLMAPLHQKKNRTVIVH